MHMPLEKYVHKSPKWESIFPLKVNKKAVYCVYLVTSQSQFYRIPPKRKERPKRNKKNT